MTDVAPDLQNVQLQSVQFKAAASEFTMQTLAAAQNFLNYFTYAQKEFFLNGNYSDAIVPFYGADGVAIFEFDAQIIDVWVFNQVAGSSGTTTVDVQIMTSPGGTWTSIFTTQPSISYQAGNDVWVGAPNPSLIGQQYSPPPYFPPANTTAPVLDSSVTNLIPARSAMRLNLTSVQSGGESFAALIHYRNI